jgi:hypothetical protein
VRFRPRFEILEGRDLPSTLTLLNANDSGPGSLRAEIAAAQDGDTIAVPSAMANQEIVLTSGQLVIDKSLTIQGTIAGALLISGNSTSRVFDLTSSSATVTLSRLMIFEGAADRGAGILNEGSALTLSACLVAYNTAIGANAGSDGVGGGVYNAGSLTVRSGYLYNNEALGRDATPGGSGGNGLGGAIYNAAGARVTIVGAQLFFNGAVGGGCDPNVPGPGGNGLGGCLCNAGGSVSLTRVSLYYNGASGGPGIPFGVSLGGAVYVGGGSLSVTNSSITESFVNQVDGIDWGGAIYEADGSVSLTNTTFSGNGAFDSSSENAGGAIYQAGGTLVLTNDSFANNGVVNNPYNGLGSALGGAIYVAAGSLTVQNCDFSGNAAQVGGAIYIAGGTVCISKNTTFVDNFASTSDPDVFGNFTVC